MYPMTCIAISILSLICIPPKQNRQFRRSSDIEAVTAVYYFCGTNNVSAPNLFNTSAPTCTFLKLTAICSHGLRYLHPVLEILPIASQRYSTYRKEVCPIGKFRHFLRQRNRYRDYSLRCQVICPATFINDIISLFFVAQSVNYINFIFLAMHNRNFRLRS